jgi:hypothetical protein
MTDNLVMYAILAMDAYNRGYQSQLNVSGDGLGDATVINTDANRLPSNAQSVAFYASAYDWNGQTVISYRGTNVTTLASALHDVLYGYGVGGGLALSAQAYDAIIFFQRIAIYEDPSLAPGGADASDWQSADITVTGHSLGGGLAGFVGAIYGLGGVLFDNMTFTDGVTNAYNDAVHQTYFGMWAPFLYGAGQQSYAPDFSKLSAYATTGELLDGLLLRFFQVPAVNHVNSYAGYGSNPVNLHSQALLTLLLYAQEKQLTAWNSIGSALYDAYFNSGKLGTAVGFQQGVTGAGAPNSQMLAAIAYSALDSGSMPFGDTGIKALFADADTLGHIVSNSGFSGVMSGNKVTNALAEILVQHAGDLAKSANTDSSAASGIFSNSSNVLSIDLTSGWTQTFSQSNQGNSSAQTTKIVGLGDLANAVLANVSSNVGAYDPLSLWALNSNSGLTTRLNEITTIQAASGANASLSGPGALQASDGNPGGALLIGNDGQGAITGSANGNDLIIGGATVNTGNGNDIIVTSAGSETLTLGSGNNQILAGGDGVSDTYNYTSETGTDLIIGNSQGADTFIFNGADHAAFTVVWGGSGDDTYDINETSPTDVLLLTMNGVTASNITSLDMSALQSYVDQTYVSNGADATSVGTTPTIVILNATSSDTLKYNGTVVSSPGIVSSSGTAFINNVLDQYGASEDVRVTDVVNRAFANGLGFNYYDYYPNLSVATLNIGSNTGGLNLVNFKSGEFGVSLDAGVAPESISVSTGTAVSSPGADGVIGVNLNFVISEGYLLGLDPRSALSAPALNINDYLVAPSRSALFAAAVNSEYVIGGSNNGGGGGVSGNDPTVSASEFASDQSNLDFQDSGFQVADTAVNISSVIDALSNDSNVTAITLTDSETPALQLSASQVANDTAALDEITNATYVIDIDDTAADVSANFDALNADNNVSAITLSDGGTPSLTLSVGQALVDTAALGKITNANYSIAIFDTAADVSNAIDALEADANVTSITLVDSGTPTLDLSVSQALNDTSILAEISNTTYAIQIEDTVANVLGDATALGADAQIAGITIVDTAANVIANAAALAANSQVTSIAIEDTTADIMANAAALAANSQVKAIIVADTVANVLADAGSLSGDAIIVFDTTANVSSNIDALNADAGIDAIDLSDSGTPTLTLTAGQALGDAAALGKIRNASYAVDISDTAANVAAHLDALASVRSLGAIALMDTGTPSLTVSAVQIVNDATVLADISNPNVAIDVSDTAADVAANIDALDSNSKVASINLTDSGTPVLSVDAAQALGDTAAFARIANPAYSLSLSDTAVDISLAIDALNADDKISSITMTDSGTPTLMLSVAQLLDDTAALGEITNAGYQIEIFDSAANILSNNAAFAANSHVASTVVVDSAATVLAQAAAIAADAKVSSVFVSDTAANVSADIDALDADSELGAIALTDSGVPTLTLSVAQALDDAHVISNIVNTNVKIAISDTAANVAADIDVLNADGAIGSISLTDSGTPTLDLTVGQALADSQVLSKIANRNYGIVISDNAANVVEAAALTADNNLSGYAVTDTAANVSADFDALGAIASLSSIKLTDSDSSSLTLSASQALDNTGELGKIVGAYSIIVADDVANVLADEAGLSADADVSGVNVTDTAANVLNNAAALAADGKVVSLTVSDTAADILADASGLAADTQVGSVNVVDSAANILANGAALNADSDLSSIEVVDTEANIAANFAALSQVNSRPWIGMTIAGSPTLTLSVAEALDTERMSGSFTVDVVDAAANIAANIDQLDYMSTIGSVIAIDGGVAMLALTVTQALHDGKVLGLIGSSNYQIVVNDTSANVSANIDALNADSAVSFITLSDTGTPTLMLTVAQALNETRALGKITNAEYGVVISDTAANVLANASALQADSRITSTTVVDTAANILNNRGALATDLQITTVTVEDSAANVVANGAALSSDSQITAVGVSDTAADISANIDALNELTVLSSVTATDYNPLTLTAAQALNDTNVLNVIRNSGVSVDVSDTAADIVSNLSALETASYIGLIIVEDTSANIVADLPIFNESSLTIQFSVTSPAIVITSAAEGSNVATQVIEGIVDYWGSSIVAGQPVTLTDNSTVLGTAILQADGSFTTTVTLPNEGANLIVVSVTDSNGVTATSGAVVDTLDDVPPTVTITSLPESGNIAAQTIAGTVVSGGAALVVGQTVTLTDNGTTLGTATVQADDSFTANVTLTDEGANSIIATVTDSYGNTGSSAAVVDTLDDLAPTLAITDAPVPNDTAVQMISGTVASGGAAAVVGQTVTLTDNGNALGTATVQSNGTFSASVTLPDQSTNAILASATDSFGNTNNTYLATAGSGQIAIAAQGSAGTANDLDFTGGITDQNLWFLQSGNNLQIDILGTNTSVTATNWFSSSSNQLQEITAGGLKIDSQVSQLVQAMATYSADNSGFDPTASSIHTVPNDGGLQPAMAAAWHA